MIRNEKGFMYPVTLCLLVLCTLFLTIQVEQNLNEKKLYYELKENIKKDYSFLYSIKKIETSLREEIEQVPTGTIHVSGGIVEYMIVDVDESLTQITLKYHSNSNGLLGGVGYYDKTLKKMIKWTEND